MFCSQCGKPLGMGENPIWRFQMAGSNAKTAIFREMTTEVSQGLGSFFSFKTETYRNDGKVISGTVRETGYALIIK